MSVEVREASVGSTHDAHAVPEPRGAQELVDHVAGPAQLVAGVLIQVRCLAHVVDLLIKPALVQHTSLFDVIVITEPTPRW